MKYDLVILNYNNVNKLAFALESLKQGCFYKPNIVVIDNSSTDNSVAFLKLKRTNHIKNESNLLFTRAYTKYFKENPIKEKYFVIANNDLVFEKNWDKYLIDFMENNENCGIVAPMLTDISGQQVQNMGGMPDFCSHKGGTPEQWKYPENSIWTTFGCVMIRTEAYLKVGGMDEQFLFYCSDSDLCLRMGFAGYKIFNIPQSRVRHYHGQATRVAIQQGIPIQAIGHQDQMKFNKLYEMHGILIGQNREPVLEAVL